MQQMYETPEAPVKMGAPVQVSSKWERYLKSHAINLIAQTYCTILGMKLPPAPGHGFTQAPNQKPNTKTTTTKRGEKPTTGPWSLGKSMRGEVTAASSWAFHTRACVFTCARIAAVLAELVLGTEISGILTRWILLRTEPAKLFTLHSTSSHELTFSQQTSSSKSASTSFLVFAGKTSDFPVSCAFATGVGETCVGMHRRMRASRSASSCSLFLFSVSWRSFSAFAFSMASWCSRYARNSRSSATCRSSFSLEPTTYQNDDLGCALAECGLARLNQTDTVCPKGAAPRIHSHGVDWNKSHLFGLCLDDSHTNHHDSKKTKLANAHHGLSGKTNQLNHCKPSAPSRAMTANTCSRKAVSLPLRMVLGHGKSLRASPHLFPSSDAKN